MAIINISNGITSSGLIISSGYSVTVSSGGVANNTTVCSGGDMYISSGGIANGTTAYYAGFINNYGGVANRTTVNYGGRMCISSGGVANSTTVNDMGDVYIYSGGVANSTTVNNGYMYIAYGGTANSTTIDNGRMCISSGGVANNTTIDNARMYISSGGTANHTTVNSGGDVYIYSGGTATALLLSAGGILGGFSFTEDKYFAEITNGSAVLSPNVVITFSSMVVSSGGTANNTICHSRQVYIKSGGVANSTTVNRGGSMHIFNGGTAIAIKENGGCVSVDNGAVVTFVSNTISGVSLYNNDVMTVHKNTVANSTSIAYGSIRIYGGVANNTTISGCSARMSISSGGVTNSTTVSSGSMYINSSGTANDTTVSSGGYMLIDPSGVANNTAVNSGGSMEVLWSGTANNTTVNSGGYMRISGTATNVIWTPCVGKVFVCNGAYVTYASRYTGVYFGSNNELLSHTQSMTGKVFTGSNSMYVMANGAVNSTTVCSCGYMIVSGGGTANNTTIYGGSSYIYISDSGTANNTTIDIGYMCIYSGGVANSTTVNSGGWMYISSGGVANNTTINSFIMIISSGGTHRGVLSITSGYVSADRGGIIDFTVSDRTTADGYLINNLSRISGAPTYTITVSSNQAEGTYKLAQGAGSFTGSITIGNGNVNYGSITVNGDEFETDTHSYRLVKTDGNLDLVVENRQPDLRISTFDVSKNSITPQESTKLTFQVFNDGETLAPESMIKVYDGDTLLREIALGEIAAGASRNCYITIPAGKLTVGTHKIYVVVDANNTVIESNENNNRAYRTLFVKESAAQADLRMAEYAVSSNSITTQESVKLTFKVYNDGNADAPASMIKVYDGDTLLREVALGEIAAGAYRNCYIPLTAGKLSVGTHKVNVVLDAGNGIAESNENNNNSYRTIFVKAATAQPDLRMAEYDVSSNSITTQESVKLTFKVYNDGNANAPESMIKVYDGDTLLREVALGEIAAGGSRSCYITLTAGKLSVGTHKVNVVLDSGNLIAEPNENNNTSYRTIFVKEPVRSLAAAPKENNSWDVCGTGSVDALCGGNYADLGEWSLENSAALTRSAADILTTGNEESRLLNSGKLAG